MVVAFVVLGSAQSSAQVYPSRQISMIVPFSAGGPSDVIGRIFAEYMTSWLGQSVIIENVTGGAGTIAMGRVARAAADGYTLIVGQ
jgi:tripartite-type tricarboxylate transporter receptor subunit TctC